MKFSFAFLLCALFALTTHANNSFGVAKTTTTHQCIVQEQPVFDVTAQSVSSHTTSFEATEQAFVPQSFTTVDTNHASVCWPRLDFQTAELPVNETSVEPKETSVCWLKQHAETIAKRNSVRHSNYNVTHQRLASASK